jgi:hypothetical protein
MKTTNSFANLLYVSGTVEIADKKQRDRKTEAREEPKFKRISSDMRKSLEPMEKLYA